MAAVPMQILNVKKINRFRVAWIKRTIDLLGRVTHRYGHRLPWENEHGVVCLPEADVISLLVAASIGLDFVERGYTTTHGMGE